MDNINSRLPTKWDLFENTAQLENPFGREEKNKTCLTFSSVAKYKGLSIKLVNGIQKRRVFSMPTEISNLSVFNFPHKNCCGLKTVTDKMEPFSAEARSYAGIYFSTLFKSFS